MARIGPTGFDEATTRAAKRIPKAVAGGKPPRPRGRPTKYTAEMAQRICERISLGESLRTITAEDSMPDRVTVLRWLDAKEDFRTHYSRARDHQADALAEEGLETGRMATQENAAAARVHLESIKWFAGKVAPKKYGDRQQIEHTGKDGGPIKTENTTTLDASALDPEGRQVLRAALLSAKGGKDEE